MAARRAAVAGRLVALMRELEARGRRTEGSKGEMDPETEEKLRSLGYIR